MDKANMKAVLQKYTMIIVLILVTLFFTWKTGGKILLPQNISNLISQNAYVFVLATGMLLCILTGGNIDLSVGSVVCFVGAVGAVLMENFKMNMGVAVIAMLVIGTLIGAWQGYWIAFVRIPPFITTLSGMLVFRGLSNVVLNGLTVSLNSEAFIKIFGGGANCFVPDFFGVEGFNLTCMLAGILAVVIYVLLQVKGRMSRVKKGYEVDPISGMLVKTVLISAVILAFAYKLSRYKGIPSALLWVLIVVLVYGYITSNTTTGRYFYAVGGNEKATKLSGINTDKVYFIAYLNMGFLSALAGMLTIARMTSAQPTYGQNYEMDAIGSCFIGGASAYGGVGTVPGVIVGAILMGVINLGMSIMGVDANYQRVVKGLVLLAAVIFDVVSKKGAQK
ncbi:MAG: sugar ABC transporter permease [Lachnospiraceae bacterium]|jgi:putative multiple sugar transport system permease protein|uniref:multiple monosaccharide ABC transporter permease n=1 Tax=Candidatus Merdisoma sp. JLR.KK011 TaxID=3114299 RepID=UPI001434A862|nr:sugar ABC transporter permease [Lachnospiraceae bacterium]MCI9250900.1 sugar ABC transporter permease [Lachnospiraceae bacterium]MCI9383259.1 sugar ABC transporter permease [Lachnospiraceae bacterium]MCI9477454.1 sugar ABC transporter permease [Lachnospiraceae bacterium]MCI9622634.1 sugar ABC transporter permease [Lachnospiraceae bacterium]